MAVPLVVFGLGTYRDPEPALLKARSGRASTARGLVRCQDGAFFLEFYDVRDAMRYQKQSKKAPKHGGRKGFGADGAGFWADGG